jgi:hypothetical protein
LIPAALVSKRTTEPLHDPVVRRTMSPNKKLVESYFASKGTDYARVLSDEVELIEWGEGVPASGVRTRGRSAFVENRGSREYETQISRMTEEDNVVVVEGTARGNKDDGKPWVVQFLDIFELENDKVKRLIAFGVSVQAGG